MPEKKTGYTMAAKCMAEETDDVYNIIRFMKESFPVRTIKEELEKLLREKSKEALINESGSETSEPYDEAALQAKQDELLVKLKNACGTVSVRGWLNGNVKNLKKSSALKIAFCLEMDYKETNKFLMQSCWLDGLYMRDYKDIIYRFCLDNKLGYTEAEKLIAEHSDLEYQPNQNLKKGVIPGARRVTEFFNKKAESLREVIELNTLISQYKEYMGSFRYKPYELFMEFYQIIKENTHKEDDSDFSSKDEKDEVICEMIKMGIPNLRGNCTIINDVLRKIAKNALSQTTLSEIKEKTEIKREAAEHGQVTEIDRKHLILAYLLANGGAPDLNVYNNSVDEALANIIAIINDDILQPCGMPTIDYRNPFDWIVYHALSYSYHGKGIVIEETEEEDDDFIDPVERINEVIEKLFERTEDEQ